MEDFFIQCGIVKEYGGGGKNAGKPGALKVNICSRSKGSACI